jgi:hypothetical protein
MKKLLFSTLSVFLFLGCSSNATNQNVTPALVVNQSVASLKLNDQHALVHEVSDDTKKIIFAFSKDIGHACNDFFATKSPSYLTDNRVVFVADVSGAPSLVRSMFILPGLKDFKHTVLVIDDKNVSATYKAGMESEKIVVVSLQNRVITGIKALNSTAELEAEIAK